MDLCQVAVGGQVAQDCGVRPVLFDFLKLSIKLTDLIFRFLYIYNLMMPFLSLYWFAIRDSLLMITFSKITVLILRWLQ